MHSAVRRAFTLIELLVVMAVISILASLLMPTVVRALAQSEKTHCKSNLSQLGHGLMLYGTSHDHLLPPFGYYTVGDSPPYRSPFWSEIMAAFLYPTLPRNERLDNALQCPLWTGSHTYYSRGYTCNYGNVFRYFCPGHGGQGPLHGQGSMHRTEIHAPSSTMLLMDGSHGFCYTPLIWTRKLDLDGDGIIDTYSTTVPLYNGGAPFRHDGVCCVLFADGHVDPVRARQWLTDDSLWDPYP
jgi:prepilin-type N-terminal cleavage/methylation domain-containing protein/prepilin-type processing-associated H-X9-DG protein